MRSDFFHSNAIVSLGADPHQTIDYPAFLAALQSIYGSNYLSVFGAGTCGDLNHLDVSRTESTTGANVARDIAERIAGAELEARATLRPLMPNLALKRPVVRWELQPPDPVAGAVKLKLPLPSFPKDRHNSPAILPW